MSSKIDDLRSAVEEARDEIRALSELDEITPEDDERLTKLVEELPTREAALAEAEQRQAVIDRVRENRSKPQPAADFNINVRKDEPTDVLEDRTASPQQLADAVTRNVAANDVDDTNLRRLLKRHKNDTRWARNLLARSTDVYADAFSKYLTGREMLLSAEERAAIVSGTNANGGFLLPTHLDPSVILSNDGSSNALRPISRVVTLTEGDTWNGITSAGVTASFDAELTEVSDDSPTFSNPQIQVHKAAAFVQASVEAFQDIGGLESEVMMMFADAKDRLEGAAHCTGTGTNEPTGIFTAIDASGNETVSTTAATIGLVDLQAVRRAVGQRWRNRSTWVTNPEWGDEVKRLGAALSASYSTDITQSNTDRLLGRPLVETDDAPAVATTTALDDRFVFGDFSNYVIVDKPGSVSVQFIPTLFNTSNNLPDGRSGWYMYWRTGADSVNDAAFQLLMDKTSA